MKLPLKILCSYRKFRIKSLALTSQHWSAFSFLNLQAPSFGISAGGDETPGSDDGRPKLPEPPTNCCMSGCANCVWIEYAEQLTKIFNDSGEKSQKIILEKVTDPNMKAFLLAELRSLQKKRS